MPIEVADATPTRASRIRLARLVAAGVVVSIVAVLAGFWWRVATTRSTLPPRIAVLRPRAIWSTVLGFAPDGSKIAVRNETGRIAVWDVPSTTPGPLLPGSYDGLGFAFSPDARIFAATSLDAAPTFHQVVVREVATGALLASFPLGSPSLAGFRFEDSGRRFRIIARNSDRKNRPDEPGWVIREFDTTGWEEIGHYAVPVGPRPFAEFGDDARSLITGEAKTAGVQMWDTDTGALLGSIPIGVLPNPWVQEQPFTLSPDGKILAAWGGSGWVELWDSASKRLISRIQGLDPGFDTTAVVPSKNSARVVVMGIIRTPAASLAGTVRDSALAFLPYSTRPSQNHASQAAVVDLSLRRVVGRIPGACWGIASPDGKTLATTGPTGEISLWDLSVPE